MISMYVPKAIHLHVARLARDVGRQLPQDQPTTLPTSVHTRQARKVASSWLRARLCESHDQLAVQSTLNFVLLVFEGFHISIGEQIRKPGTNSKTIPAQVVYREVNNEDYSNKNSGIYKNQL